MVISVFGRNIRALREKYHLTQTEFAERTGVTLTTVSGWETRGIQPRQGTLLEIAQQFNVSVDDLVSENGYYAKTRGVDPLTITPKPSNTFLPVLGAVPAGDPREAIENYEGEEWCPPKYCKEGNFFLRVTGDSMDKIIPDGSYVLVDTYATANSGDLALVKVNGDEATIKRIRFVEGAIFLEPCSTNPEHQRRIIDRKSPECPEITIMGRVVYAGIDLE